MKRIGTLSFILTSLIACAGTQRGTTDTDVTKTLAKLQADARAQKRKISDLEKELMLKKAAQVDTSTYASAEIPVLPVEEVSAETLDQQEELPVDYDIVGTDDEGTQIVYVGEARVKKSVRVPVGKYDLSARGSSPVYARTMNSRESVSKNNEVFRLQGNEPTIEAQLRQARAATMPERKGSSANPRNEYQRYYEALQAGNHTYAVTGFRNFIKRYRTHDYADNAQYWLGEAYYDQKDFANAETEFRRVIEIFPGTNKVPDALLKLGYCLEKQGELGKAKAVLGQVLSSYPDGNPARLAQLKMDELGNKK